MKFKSFFIVTLFLIFLTLILGFYFSTVFPVMNIFLLSEGWISPFQYSFWISGIILLLFLGAILFPKIDPLKPDFNSFSKEYYLMVLISQLFVLYFLILDLFRANGFEIDVVSWLSLGFAFLFWFTGKFLLVVKRSWFFGLRTPWTIKSDEVFNNTNRLGGRLLKIVAIFSVVGFLLGDSCLYFSVMPFVLVFLFLFFYSYILYKNQ